jgi:hypothetical protein
VKLAYPLRANCRTPKAHPLGFFPHAFREGGTPRTQKGLRPRWPRALRSESRRRTTAPREGVLSCDALGGRRQIVGIVGEAESGKVADPETSRRRQGPDRRTVRTHPHFLNEIRVVLATPSPRSIRSCPVPLRQRFRAEIEDVLVEVGSYLKVFAARRRASAVRRPLARLKSSTWGGSITRHTSFQSPFRMPALIGSTL